MPKMASPRPTAFLSTLPARGATDVLAILGQRLRISIHAPREGSDAGPCNGPARPGHFYPRSPRGERRHQVLMQGEQTPYFYPRSPRGERHHNIWACILFPRFLSTLPARGATAAQAGMTVSAYVISIHAPREGSDFGQMHLPKLHPYISIHAPREGSDAGIAMRTKSGL